MTIWEAASATESLWVIFWGAIVVLPTIIGYTIYSYKIFWGKTEPLSYYWWSGMGVALIDAHWNTLLKDVWCMVHPDHDKGASSLCRRNPRHTTKLSGTPCVDQNNSTKSASYKYPRKFCTESLPMVRPTLQGRKRQYGLLESWKSLSPNPLIRIFLLCFWTGVSSSRHPFAGQVAT